MKECRRCRLLKSVSDFHRDRSQPNGLQYLCKSCIRERDRERYARTHVPKRVYRRPEDVMDKDRAYRRAWYARNTEHAKNHVKDRVKALVAWASAYKEAQACAACGEGDPVCLEFHHRNPAEKEEDVARAVRLGWSPRRLEVPAPGCGSRCGSAAAMPGTEINPGA